VVVQETVAHELKGDSCSGFIVVVVVVFEGAVGGWMAVPKQSVKEIEIIY